MDITIYENTKTLPVLLDNNFFHSRKLMELCEHAPRHKPYLAVVCNEAGDVVSQLLAIERSRRSWLPPYLYRHVFVIGDGDYRDGISDELFGMMIEALTRHLYHRALYIEFTQLSHKMSGYKPLRANGYFPVRWMNVHNSLHSRTPEERLTERQRKYIRYGLKRGVTMKMVADEQDFQECMTLLRRHLWLKPRRYVPDSIFFREMMEQGRCDILMAQFHDKTIGCSVSVYSQGDAYLWYSASLRKSYAALHPNVMTYWFTIKHAASKGCQHIRFMDVGLPFRKNPYRDFILRFGGKEVSSYRWFRISIRWVNRLASWMWRE